MMGSDLYINIEVHPAAAGDRTQWHWQAMWHGPSTFLARGIVVDAFGDANPDGPTGRNRVEGYHDPDHCPEFRGMGRPPWSEDDPYWVRVVSGEEFVAIVREKRWQKLQDGDFANKECDPELRAMATLVDALRAEGLVVRVWCWHSQ